jgi:hypothetical protein
MPRGQYGAPPPPPRKGGAGKIVLALVVLVALVGGAGYVVYRHFVPSSAAPGSAAPAAPGAGGSLPGPDRADPLACPFTAAQVSAMIGQPMTDSGNCAFGDGAGVAQLGIEIHSLSSTEGTYDYNHAQADKDYLLVEDLKNGDKGFMAYKNTSAQAFVIKSRSAYTITMSKFERFDSFSYEQPLQNVISALPN